MSLLGHRTLPLILAFLLGAPASQAQCPYQQPKTKQVAPSKPAPRYKAQYRKSEGRAQQQKWY